MFRKDASRRRPWRGRAVSLFLAAALLLGMAPGLTLPASADHWADSHLDQLVDWGVMRADQAGDPDAPITRAEFMAVVNRAYGYTEMGPIPFTDVSPSDWYYDDVAIAYTAGYMKGTSETTAAPNASLTREQAVCILGRNMMLKETPGEDLAFSDSRSISGWARGMIKTAVNNYIVNGYPDDTFRPQADITKGQMAALVTQCVGVPISEGGVSTLGDVSGNVTITAPNVTLRGTTVSGDLYISGGVGLGGIKLENVNVLGRIIVSGTGESEGGSASVIMRNVTANELLVDNMRKKYVTVRADGITEIARTTVRTNAYLEDNNTDDKGLLRIELDGGSGTRLDLAGRIKRVVDKTPNSFVQMAKGSAQSITVDEAATNSTIQINRNTEVKELNLDVAANVIGEGDVGRLNINAPGSTVTMLPDDIYIRPGITGNVNGVVMDSASAEESATGPRLLSGYPAANDLAPTALRADFSGNKKGTVYWGVSSVSDGSIGAADLISPPSYGSKAVRGGSLGLPAGDTVGSAKISGLTVGGSYYLSAVLVDGRGERSPVKVISFTTPDNTVPAFAQGYPYMSLISDNMAQVTVMPTKTCKLYYAVLLKGAKAPTANELRSAAVTGNLGYGVVDVVKNTERVINVSNRLQELKDYTLYLWLTDVDGGKSSSVTSLQFKTVDKTAPEFDPHPDSNNSTAEATSVKLTAGLNEPGTIYWVAVPKGKAYPPPNNNSDPLSKDNIMSGSEGNSTGGTPVSAKLDSEYAKNQVKNHKNTTIYGSVRVAKADTEVTINVTKLKEAAAYDFYYVAQDTVGNFSKEVYRITIQTRDTVGPVVTEEFTGDKNGSPTVDSEIILRFNESISVANTGDLLELYQKNPGEVETVLRSNFALYTISGTDTPRVTEDKTDSTWVDYSKVIVRASERVEGAVEVVFDPAKGAIKMTSGTQYYFELKGVRDLTGNAPKGKTATDSISTLNPTNCKGTEHKLTIFETVFAWVSLDTHADPPTAPKWKGSTESGHTNTSGTTTDYARVDASFVMRPQSTRNANANTRYDLIVLADGDVDYDLYYRILDSKGDYKDSEGNLVTTEQVKAGYGLSDIKDFDKDVDENGWVYLGNKPSNAADFKKWDGMSLAWHLNGADNSGAFPSLNALSQDLQYEFVVTVTKKDALSTFGLWRNSVNFRAYVLAGGGYALRSFAADTSLQPEDIRAFDVGVSSTTGKSIGTYRTEDYVSFQASFGGSTVPEFTVGPEFTAGATSLNIKFTLQDRGYVYYTIAPRDEVLDTEITLTDDLGGAAKGDVIKSSGEDGNKLWNVITAQTALPEPYDLKYTVTTDKPSAGNIVNDRYKSLRRGTLEYDTGGRSFNKTVCLGTNPNDIKDYRLEAGKDYYIYMVITDISGRSSKVYIYNFTTGAAAKPKIGITDNENGRVTIDTRPGTNDDENVAASLKWRLFNTVDANNMLSALGEVEIPEKDANGKAFTKDFRGSGKISILYAMSTRYNAALAYGSSVPEDAEFGMEYNNFSLFDVFANETLKFNVDNKIRNGHPGTGSINDGSATTVPTLLQDTVTWYPGNGGQKDVGYVLLVAGHNSIYDQDSSGSGSTVIDWSIVDSFAARTNVTNRNMNAPQLEGTNSKQLGGGIEKITGTGEKTYTGSVTIEFDQDLYWKKEQGDTATYMVQPGSAAATDATTGTGATPARVGILYDYWGPSTGITSSGTVGTTPMRRFNIKFTDIPATSFTLLPTGVISSRGGNEASSAIEIRIVDETRGTGVAAVSEVYVEVSYEGKTQRTRVFKPSQL